MKRIVLIITLLILSLSHHSMAGNTTYQTIYYQILPINEIWVSGNPPVLVIDSAQPGEGPEEAVDSSTTYTVVTNEGMFVTPEKPKKITGHINEAMPEHTHLIVNLSPPVDAESMGDVTLTDEPQTLVNYILAPGKALTITYKFGASAEAGTLSGIRNVTFTLTDEV
jgi:hypothetical protein